MKEWNVAVVVCAFVLCSAEGTYTIAHNFKILFVFNIMMHEANQ